MIRRLWPDRNPLRRTADRVEAAVMAALLAVFLAGAPLAAMAAAGRAATSATHAGLAQAHWHRVPAVLLRNAPVPAHALAQASLEPLVPARWTAPDGTAREGTLRVPGGTAAGTTVMVWTDGSGRLTGAPARGAGTGVQEAVAALAAVVVAAGAVAVAGLFAGCLLERRRLAAWDTAWSRTGPQWTGRR